MRNMKLKGITEEQLETMSYDDVAYEVLKANGKKMSLSDLFDAVCDLMHLDKALKEEYIAEFFTLLSTEKRFIKLDKGFWDLRENHTARIELSELEEEEETETEEAEVEETEDDSMYIDETKEADDDEAEDEYKDLVVIDEDSEAEL